MPDVVTESHRIPETGLEMIVSAPLEPKTGIPVVLLIKGGGFHAQHARSWRHVAELFAGHGLATASISYRGRPEHPYPDTLADVHHATQALVALAEFRGWDAKRLGVAGRSAGGTLSALAATSDPRFRAAALMAGVYDWIARFTDPAQRALQPEVEERQRNIATWMGEPFSANAPAWHTVSAQYQIRPDHPPTLLLHCRDDAIVPWQQSRDYHRTLRENGVDATFHLYEDGGHGFGHADPHDVFKRAAAFLAATL